MFRAFCIISMILLLEFFAPRMMAQTPIPNQQKLKQLFFKLDNDWFVLHQQTDRYYTFGIDAGINFIPKKYFESDKNDTKLPSKFYSVNISLKGFTPEIGGDGAPMKQKDMRAFAGYLLGSFETTTRIRKKSVLKYNLRLGVLGPASNVGNLQNWFHERIGYPLVRGWEGQMQNRFIANVHAGYYGTLLSGKTSDIFFTFDTDLGNMLTAAQSALALRLGKFNPISSSVSVGNSILADKNECFLEFRAGTKLAAYDATLQTKAYYTPQKINNLRKYAELGWHTRMGNLSSSMRLHFEERWVHHEDNHFYGSVLVFYAF